MFDLHTTIHNLRMQAESTFDQPSTEAGKLFKRAISYASDGRDWLVIVWGRQVECRENVLLMFRELERSFPTG